MSRACRSTRNPALRGCAVAFACLLLAGSAAAAVRGDLSPAGGDGKHTVRDAVRMAALLRGGPITPEERATGNLAPAASYRQECWALRAEGTGALNGVGARIDYSPTELAITAAEDLNDPASDVRKYPGFPAQLQLANTQVAGRVSITGALAVNQSVPLPLDTYALRFTLLGATAAPPTISRCTLTDPTAAVIPSASCALQQRRPPTRVLVPPTGEPLLDQGDLDELVELIVGRAALTFTCVN